MSYAIRVHEYGGPEVLKWEKVEVGDPGPGEIKIRQAAVGLNFIDVYQRSGLYPQPSFPFIPGMEMSMTITSGFNARAPAMAAFPSLASETTFMSG